MINYQKHCGLQYVHKRLGYDNLFGLDMLELLWRMKKVVRIGLRDKLALIRFLDEIFITLFLSKCDSVFLRLEVDMRSLHAVGG